MNNKIEVTGVNLVDLVKHVYDLSKPQGMGFLHYKPEPLTDDEAKSLIDTQDRTPISLDYVRGRACKFNVFKSEDGTLWINTNWYDHSDEQLKELLSRVGLAEKIDQVA